MDVVREGIGDPACSHYDERKAVCHAPAFVKALAVERECLAVKRLSELENLNRWVLAHRRQELACHLAVLRFRKTVPDFEEDCARGDDSGVRGPKPLREVD